MQHSRGLFYRVVFILDLRILDSDWSTAAKERRVISLQNLNGPDQEWISVERW
jgi:hypothetical protein